MTSLLVSNEYFLPKKKKEPKMRARKRLSLVDIASAFFVEFALKSWQEVAAKMPSSYLSKFILKNP